MSGTTPREAEHPVGVAALLAAAPAAAAVCTPPAAPEPEHEERPEPGPHTAEAA